MSGICGWFGGGTGAVPDIAIGRMGAALTQFAAGPMESTCGADFGLAARAHPAMGAFAIDGDVSATIEGYPLWRDPALAEIARDHGHAQALIAAYRSAGAALFSGLSGTFSLAILDRSTHRALLAIDRVGVQSMCYAEPGRDLLVFGSTTDAVRAHPNVHSSVAVQSIFDYLYFGDRIPAPKTIYVEQRKLAPGEFLLWEGGRCQIGRASCRERV